jgi:hypothetical protein
MTTQLYAAAVKGGNSCFALDAVFWIRKLLGSPKFGHGHNGD